MKILILTAIAIITFSACKKDGGSTPPAPPEYMPMTAGSTWTYQPSQGSAYTLTATSRDTVALGKTFKVFTNSNGENRYRMKSGNDYYRLTIIPDIAPNGFAELYLKDNQPVKSTWKISLPVSVPNIPIPLTADLNYTIKAKDTTVSVNNKVFNKVIRVRLDVSLASFGTIGGGDFYYADKVGLVETKFEINMQGQQVNQSEILTAYSIK